MVVVVVFVLVVFVVTAEVFVGRERGVLTDKLRPRKPGRSLAEDDDEDLDGAGACWGRTAFFFWSLRESSGVLGMGAER